jgi:hypothetical protein
VAFGASGPDADMVVQVSLDVIDATIAGTPVPAEVEIGTDQGSVRIQRHLRADQVCT